MHSRISIAIFSLSLLFLQQADGKAEQKKRGSRPNIILCMADDQGWGDVGYYNATQAITPVLDEMARTGLRFDRFYAAAPVCSPTRASVLTGRHPNRMGCFSWGLPLRPQEITLAEMLQEAGYATGHFGKWHLGSVHPKSAVCPGNSGFETWLSAPNFYENNPLMCFNGKVTQTEGESSQVPVDYAVDFMKHAQKENKPFFAVIWFGSPHLPHIATEEMKALYPNEKPKMQNFLGELTGIDRAMGSLKTSIKQIGIGENTVLWYTSDNGALKVGSTAGLSGRKGSLLEGGVRVPAIIEWPGTINKPRLIDDVCSTVDIYPTVLELAGVSQKKCQPVLDGQSLVPIIESQNFKRNSPLGFWVYEKRGRVMKSTALLENMRDHPEQTFDAEPDPSLIAGNIPTTDRRGHATWLDGDWKLHRIPNKKGDDFRYQLFNLKTDPAEKKDLLTENTDRVSRMKKELARWQVSVINSLNGKDY